jgi:hypothetical protein
MKFATISKSLVMGAALLLASSAFAVTKGNLELNNAATISGTKLNPGDYKLEWDGTGPDVQVSVMKGRNVVAKVQGKLVDLPSPSAGDSVVFTTGENGANNVAGVRFNGKKYALDLSGTGAGMVGGSSK